MGDYTLVNLKEVEDQAPRFGVAELEARFAGGPLGLEESGMSYQRLAPNARGPWGHRHRRQEEIYVILAGGGRLKLDEEIVEVNPLDAVRVGTETMRCFEAGPDGLELLAFGAPRAGESAAEDVEMVPNWWQD